ncbi:MAG: transcriptional repressor LexA [Coriobacteriia bacterium]|nr:transcriptional repressor LexA [Coriobacteriia bacterium]MCL2749602.1 transcriptional repressor LexA [Coriobacteriia bacterium]
MPRDIISKRQLQVLAYIAEYSALQGYPPSVRDIGEHVGLASPSTVFSHLSSLERKGFIRKEKDSARALIILDKGWEALRTHGYAAEAASAPGAAEPAYLANVNSYHAVSLPLVGEVAAGTPLYADQNITDSFTLPKQVVGDRGSFMLTIKGNSMIEAGINDGDYVVVREQPTAENGDIVVALMDDEATVKTFYREKDSIRLQPQNSSMEPIYTRDVQIIGKVIALLRAL